MQITDDVNSETMKVTTCSPTAGYGYGHGHHKRSAGEHQYCREEYQTQEYRIPKVEEPTEVGMPAMSNSRFIQEFNVISYRARLQGFGQVW